MERRQASESSNRWRSSGAPFPEPGQQRAVDACSVDDTTEVRWFMLGSLPPDVRVWFTSSIAVPEERCDTYLLVGREDVGVKRRFRETLELKVRQSLDGRVQLGEGLGGSLEEWRRWSPAEGLVDVSTDGRWVDVDKSIVKRRFCLDGTEIAFSPDPHPAGAGCDVEIAGVTVGTVQAWTFAFAAVGPPATRPEALLAAWQALVDGAPAPESLGHAADRAMGYPQWLSLVEELRRIQPA